MSRTDIRYGGVEGVLRTDTLKHGLINTDKAIKDYIQKYIGFEFSDNEQPIKPYVTFTNLQRWAEHKNSSEKKDASLDKITLPVIAIKRVGHDILHQRTPHWLSDDDLEYILYKLSEESLTKNPNEFAVITRLPIIVDVQYDITVLCYTQKHLDQIVEQFSLHESKSWTDTSYHLIVKYQSITDSSTIAEQMQERMMQANISLTVESYLLPKENFKERIDIKIIPSSSTVEVQEAVLTSEEFANIFPKLENKSQKNLLSRLKK